MHTPSLHHDAESIWGGCYVDIFDQAVVTESDPRSGGHYWNGEVLWEPAHRSIDHSRYVTGILCDYRDNAAKPAINEAHPIWLLEPWSEPAIDGVDLSAEQLCDDAAPWDYDENTWNAVSTFYLLDDRLASCA